MNSIPLNLSAENLDNKIVPFSRRSDEQSLFLQQNNAYFPPSDTTAIAIKALSDQVGLMKTMLEQQQKRISVLESELTQQKNLNRGLILAFRNLEKTCQSGTEKAQKELLSVAASQNALNMRMLTICKYFEQEAFKHQVKKDAHHVQKFGKNLSRQQKTTPS